MYTNELESNKIMLCYKLEIDFNEANELFGSETLNSMQLMQVNGGWSIPWGQLWKGIKTAFEFIANAVTIYQAVSPTGGTTDGPTCGPPASLAGPTVSSSTILEVTSDGAGTLTITNPGGFIIVQHADSAIISKGNGNTSVKLYNPNFLTIPTN